MPRTVKLCRNLGTADRDRYGLTKEVALDGNEVSVSDDAADSLVSRKLAVDVQSSAKEVRAVVKSDIETGKKASK